MSVEKHSLENECFPGDRYSRVFEEGLGSSLAKEYDPLGSGAEVTVCHLVGPDLLIHPSPQYSLPLHDLADYWSRIPNRSNTTYSGLADTLQRLLEDPVYLDSWERRAGLKDFSTGEDMSYEAWYVYLRQFTSHEYISPIIPPKWTRGGRRLSLYYSSTWSCYYRPHAARSYYRQLFLRSLVLR